MVLSDEVKNAYISGFLRGTLVTMVDFEAGDDKVKRMALFNELKGNLAALNMLVLRHLKLEHILPYITTEYMNDIYKLEIEMLSYIRNVLET